MSTETHTRKHENIVRAIDGLHKNERNRIVYWEGKLRKEKKFNEFHTDLQLTLKKLETLIARYNPKNVSIIGATCYEWLLIDVASIYVGLVVHAIPETVSCDEYVRLMLDCEIDLQFGHVDCVNRLPQSSSLIFFGARDDSECNHLDDVSLSPIRGPRSVSGPYYSYAFSSGTQGKQKVLKLPYPDLASSKGKLGRSDTERGGGDLDSIFIWMSFSHYLQRWFSLQALYFGFDLIISNTKDSVINIIRERPTVMASAAVLYEMIASSAERKISKLRIDARIALDVYNFLKINRLHYRNPIKRLFNSIYFKGLVELYGGRPEQFIWSGSCIKIDALRILDRIGLQVCGGYALSELGPISTDSRKSFRIGSVGKPAHRLKISGDGEILVKWSNNMRDASHLLIDDDGYVHTGDQGYLDEDGYLYVQGRMDDIIVLSSGKNVIPTELEEKLVSCAGISNAIVHSTNNLYLEAVLEIKDIVERDSVARAAVMALNSRVRDYEKITSIRILDDFRSIDGAITPSEKIKRRALINAAFNGQAISIMKLHQ